MDLNKAQIIGRLTQDPETRTTPSGISVTSFSVATNFAWKDQSGNKKESVEYHNVVAWRRLGEIISQYLGRGSRIFIEGRLQTRSWDGQDGVKRYKTEIIADNMIMLDNKRSGAAPASDNTPTYEPAPEQTPQAEAKPTQPDEEEISVEDIPF